MWNRLTFLGENVPDMNTLIKHTNHDHTYALTGSPKSDDSYFVVEDEQVVCNCDPVSEVQDKEQPKEMLEEKKKIEEEKSKEMLEEKMKVENN